MTECDYLIVGGGSAGCAVANRLSADPASNVMLLDAGRSDRHPYVRVPAGMGMLMPREDMVWHNMAEADPTRDGRAEMWPAGKCLGGGSAINGMMFVRGHRWDYDHWARLGNAGWSFEDVLPYFKRLETSDRGASEFRGGDGPQSVADTRVKHPLIDSFIAAGQELGIPYNDDLNGASQEGIGLVQASQRRGFRHTTAAAYIWPVRSRRNLNVQLHALVSRVLFDGKRAIGVEYRQGGQTQTLLARKGVVVCAGAMASPKLLMLSGIGDPDELRAHGIAPILVLPGVGKNLQEHPGAPIRVHANIDTINSDLGPLRALAHAVNFLVDGSGALSTPIAHAHAFVRTREGLPAPNIQIIFSVVAHELVEGSARPYPKAAMSFAVGLCRVSSRGSIELHANSIEAPPKINYQLLTSEDDIAQLTEGCRKVRELVRSPALARYVRDESIPGDSVQSDADWKQFLHRDSILMYHPCGTCKMGADSSNDLAVVDARLRVHGAERLWVADASIMPTIPAGNINASCIMIGEKAADMIREDS